MPILGLDKQYAGPSKPSHFDIEKVIRPNILSLHPYRCARDDYQSGVLLDANENALGHSLAEQKSDELAYIEELTLNRYPDPSHDNIKDRVAQLRELPGRKHVFLGVGSDEVIDMLMRVTCAPGKEKILITPPTYGMYSVAAQTNDVEVVKCNLQLDDSNGKKFSLRVDEMKKTIDQYSETLKLIFICSPGNPTGTAIAVSDIRELLDYPAFKGIVVVDEAYIDFTTEKDASAVSLIENYANVCVCQTLSKGFGLAAIRLGIAMAQPPLIQILTNAKAPYNIAAPSAALGLQALSEASLATMRGKVAKLIESRGKLLETLSSEPYKSLGVGKAVGANDANFILVPLLNKNGEPDNTRSLAVYKSLAEEAGVVVRYRGGETGCLGCLRITVGTEEEIKTLLAKLELKLKEIQ